MSSLPVRVCVPNLFLFRFRVRLISFVIQTWTERIWEMRDCKVRGCGMNIKSLDSRYEIGLPQDTLGGDPTGHLFDWVNSAFFFSYVSSPPDHGGSRSLSSCYQIIFQVPASVTSKLYPPHIWMGCAALGWGLCSTLMVCICPMDDLSHILRLYQGLRLRSGRAHRGSGWNGCFRGRM